MDINDTSQLDEMKRYLFQEMPEAERDQLEERLFEDSDYFYALADLENDLVDKYARGKLTGEDLTKFEQSLPKLPARRTKIANSRALQTLIEEEKPKTTPIIEPLDLWQRIADFFSIRISALQYATAALALLLACTTGYLIYRNSRNSAELARLQSEHQAALNEKNNLQEEINLKEQERQQIAGQLENERGDKEKVQEELDKKQTELEQLKRRLENLPPLKEVSNEIAPPTPFLAVSILPVGRGGNNVVPSVKLIATGNGQKVKVTVPLPPTKDYGKFEITAGGKTLGSGAINSGAKAFSFYLTPDDTEFDINVNERATRGGSESLGSFGIKLKKRN